MHCYTVTKVSPNRPPCKQRRSTSCIVRQMAFTPFRRTALFAHSDSAAAAYCTYPLNRRRGTSSTVVSRPTCRPHAFADRLSTDTETNGFTRSFGFCFVFFFFSPPVIFAVLRPIFARTKTQDFEKV